MVYVPVALGTPMMLPTEFMARPGGRDPLAIDQE
jgi:hypothetical protein